jgi:menaquinone-dependent protoporphyrinogen oxidase
LSRICGAVSSIIEADIEPVCRLRPDFTTCVRTKEKISMNVLVAYASRHGSTQEIAEVIANEIEGTGHETSVVNLTEAPGIDGYDAAVIGSAIYVGQWQNEARQFVERHRNALQSMPVWLFSSGPIGEELFPKEEPPITPELMEKTGAIEHRSFAGKLDRSALGIGERVVSRVVRAPEGDFRDWDDIRRWARGVGETLSQRVESVTSSS